MAATSWNLSAAAWKMGSAFSELMASSMAAVHLSHPSVCRSRCLSGSMPAESTELSWHGHTDLSMKTHCRTEPTWRSHIEVSLQKHCMATSLCHTVLSASGCCPKPCLPLQISTWQTRISTFSLGAARNKVRTVLMHLMTYGICTLKCGLGRWPEAVL